MNFKITIALLATMAVGVSPIAAQAGHEGHHEQDGAQAMQEMDMASMMTMMMGSPAALLKAADKLDLSEEQRARLAELRDLQVSGHAQMMEAMHAAMTQAATDAKALLTPEQLAVLEGQTTSMDSMMNMKSMMDGSADTAPMKMDGMPEMMGSQGQAGMMEMMSGMMDMMKMCHAMMGDTSGNN